MSQNRVHVHIHEKPNLLKSLSRARRVISMLAEPNCESGANIDACVCEPA